MYFFEILSLACLAALVFFLFHLIRGSLLRRVIGGEETGITVVVRPGGSASQLEQSIRGLVRLVSENILCAGTKIVIECSVENKEYLEMAQLLSRDYEAVCLKYVSE